DFDQYLSQSSAALLPADAWLKFVPASEYSGNPPALLVRGFDNTIGPPAAITNNGQPQIVDLDPTHYNPPGMPAPLGGTFPFAVGVTQITTTITPVNDAPE